MLCRGSAASGSFGVTISAIKSSNHAAAVTRKAHQQPHILRRLKAPLSTLAPKDVSWSFVSWYESCTAQDKKALQSVVKMAQRIIGTLLRAIIDIYTRRCLRKTKCILKDPQSPCTATLYLYHPAGYSEQFTHAHYSETVYTPVLSDY